MWFDKLTMRTKFIVSANTGFSLPNFEDREESIALIGCADSDEGGVRRVHQFSSNGRYESAWLIFDSNHQEKIRHNLGTKDFRTTIYVSHKPYLDNAMIINNAGSAMLLTGPEDEKTTGMWIDNITDLDFMLKTQDYLYTYPNGDVAVASYVKVIVERTW